MEEFVQRLTAEQIAAVQTRSGMEIASILKHATKRTGHITFTKLVRRLHIEVARTLLLLLGGRSMRRKLDVGLFRTRGEVHRVMYDEFSLSRLLLACGFCAPRKVGAMESSIPGYADYELDAVRGIVRKPDSLFMEAVRP